MIRVAILGAGIGAEHLAGYQELQDRYDVAVLCDLDAERAEILGYLLATMTEEAAAALDALGARLEEEPASDAIDSWYCTTMALFAMESQETELARERFEECVESYPADVATLSAAVDFFQKEGEVPFPFSICWAVSQALLCLRFASYAEIVFMKLPVQL